MINSTSSFLCIWVLLISGAIVCFSKSHEDDLRKEILENYNPLALPSKQTNVTIRFTVVHFTMNEALQSIDLDLWVSMEWNDPRLAWTKSQHPDIERLSFEKSQIWFPDLTVYNIASNDVNAIQSSTKLLVMPDGGVMWVPPSHVKGMCVMDMTYWPYDTHSCTIKVGSWVHSARLIDIAVKDDMVNIEEAETMENPSNLTRSEWKLIDSNVYRTSKIYECCPEEYVSATANLVVHRIGESYWWSTQMPIIILGLMTVVVFVLPPTAGEKIVLAGITFFINFYFLETTSQLIGHASTHTPKIVQLISLQLLFSGASLIASGIILRLVKQPSSTRLPLWVRKLAQVLSKMLCLNGYYKLADSSLINNVDAKAEDDMEMNVSEGRSGSYSPNSRRIVGGEWLLAGAVLDRLCLTVFAALFVISMIAFSDVL